MQRNATCVKLQTAHKVNTSAWRDISHPPLYIYGKKQYSHKISHTAFVPSQLVTAQVPQNKGHSRGKSELHTCLHLLLFRESISSPDFLLRNPSLIAYWNYPFSCPRERDGESLHIKAISYCYSAQLTIKFCSRHVKRAHQLNRLPGNFSATQEWTLEHTHTNALTRTKFGFR